ncbi:MAG: hypothetical protein JSV44_03060, partial [Candidatus Zixiibacteriota bacterium]
MKRTIYLLKILTMIAGLLLLSASIIFADNDRQVEGCFVDFDGDGFDDNAPDANSDGIPDVFGPAEKAAVSADQSEKQDFVNFND